MERTKFYIKRILIWVLAPVLSWTIFIAIGLQACSHSSTSAQQEKKTQVLHSEAQPFRLPAIPGSLVTAEQRADYLALHYWDHYDFQDTTRIDLPEETEQILSDYIAILPHVSEPMVQASIVELLSQTEKGKNMFLFFTELLEKYLYDPNSPYRNEEYYLHALRFIEKSPALEDIGKSRFAYQLQSVLKNRKGTKATDFTYTLPNRSKNRMYAVQSDYLLLYFNNPGCHACEEVQAALESSAVVSEAIQSKRLKILAVYPDEDLTEWKANLSHLPTAWINGYDANQSIKNKDLYDLRAIPSLYLLDRDKMVLVKDGTVQQVEALLDRF